MMRGFHKIYLDSFIYCFTYCVKYLEVSLISECKMWIYSCTAPPIPSVILNFNTILLHIFTVFLYTA